jgi:cullin-associated NEDD8-dissociated protein 1
VKRLIDELSTSILDPKNEDLRDISAIGLKTILTQTPASAGGRRQLIAACLTHKLLEGINTVDVPEVKTHCLDVLQELIAQFGPILEKDYQKILQAVLSQLTSTRAATRKRAITALRNI